MHIDVYIYIHTSTHTHRDLQWSMNQWVRRLSPFPCNYVCFAEHCNTLQHTATHCNTLQHTATQYNTRHESTGPKTLAFSMQTCVHRYTIQHTATHCNTLQHTATHCNTLQHTATLFMNGRVKRLSPFPCKICVHCNKLQNSATHCITLQHPATQKRLSPLPCSFCTMQHTTTHWNTLPHTAINFHTASPLAISMQFRVRHKRGFSTKIQNFWVFVEKKIFRGFSP